MKRNYQICIDVQLKGTEFEGEITTVAERIKNRNPRNGIFVMPDLGRSCVKGGKPSLLQRMASQIIRGN